MMKILASLCLMSCVLLFPLKTGADNGSFETGLADNSFVRRKHSEAVEHCSVDSVYACLHYFGIDVSLRDIAERLSAENVESGVSVARLQELLHAFALHSKVVSGEFDTLSCWLREGCVGIVPNSNDKHLYVYLGQRGQEYFRYNPPYVYGWVSSDRIKADWDGVVVIVNNEPIQEAESSNIFIGPTSRSFIIYLFMVASIIFGLVALWLWSSNRKKSSACSPYKK